MTNTEVAVVDDNYVMVVIHYNALDPLQRTSSELQWEPSRVLSSYLDGLPDHVDWGVVVNSKYVTADEWSGFCPNKWDCIRLFPIPRGGGGGGGKLVLRIVGMIAIAVLSYFTGGAAAMLYAGAGATMASAMATTAGMLIAATVGMAVSMAGSMLLNVLLPPAKEKLNNQKDKKDGNVYGLDGPQNTTGEDMPVPLVYGKFRMGGNVINARIHNEGDSQYLYMMMNLGEGPITNVSDIMINNETLDKYQNVQVDWRQGTPNQAMGGWFYDTLVSGLAPNRDYVLKEDFIYQETNVIDKFRVDIVFPNGLLKFDTSNEGTVQKPLGVEIEIVYRQVGSTGAWATLYRDVIRDNRRAAIRRSFESPILAQGKYVVGVRRVTPDKDVDKQIDDVAWSDLIEIVLDDISYTNTAWYGLRIKFDEQLNAIPTVTALVWGLKVNTYNRHGSVMSWVWSDNPAWITLDILLNQRYGAGIKASRIHWPVFDDWAQYCEMKGFKFNGVFDAQSNIWDALQDVLRVGHAQLSLVGTKISLVLEYAEDASMMFGDGNIIEGTFENTWLPLADRANEFEVNYYDETDGHKQHMVKVIDYDALARGDPQRIANFTMRGITNAEQARYEAHYQMALNKYVRQSCSFEAPIEAIACMPGDLIYVQHNMPMWGEGGRVESGSTALTVVLDRPMRMEPYKQYRLLVMHAAINLGTVIVRSIIADSIYAEVVDYGQVGGWQFSAAKRLRSLGGEKDVAVDIVRYGAPYIEIPVETGRASWFYIGEQVQLWNIDVVEERDVVNNNTAIESPNITVKNAFSLPPAQYVNFLFGENNKNKKPFRVKTIAGVGTTTRKLTCIEHNESVYQYPEWATETPNYSSIPTTIGQCRFTGAEEQLYRSGNIVRTRLFVYWDAPDTLYEGAFMLVARGDNYYVNYGAVHGQATSWFLEVTEGETIQIKALAFDGAGRVANVAAADVLTHYVIGKWLPPASVQNFEVKKTIGGIVFTWKSNTELDVVGYSIRRGKRWEDPEEYIVTNYAGNRFQTSKATGGVQTYMIKAIDSSNLESVEPTYVTLTLPAPASVRNFDAIQNGNVIVFVWMANSEPDVAGYEIREGPNWASSQLIAQVSGTQHMIPNDVPGNRVFWIKAYDSSNIYSDIAAFATPMIAPMDDRNVVYEQTENPTWSNFKYNFNVDGQKLLMTLGESYGEYGVPVNLPAPFIARTVVDDSFDAVMADYFMTWQQASSLTWQSNRAWVPLGDVNSIILEKTFAQAKTPTDNEIEAFPFANFLTGIRGTTPTTNTGVTYTPGRFRNGLFVKNTTRVEYTLATLTSTFSVYFWFRPSVKTDLNIVRIYAGASSWWQLVYQADINAFLLLGSDSRDIGLTNLEWSPNHMLLVAVVQTATNRRLHVGNVVTNKWLSGSIDATPIATFNKVRFY